MHNSVNVCLDDVHAWHSMCASVLHTCMHVHRYVCVISSVFGPLKGSCGAEGEEKITGADIICFCHVGLASGLTHCSLVRHGRQVDVPAHMLWPDARTYPTHTDTHMRLCRDDLRAYRVWYAQADTFCIEKVTHLHILTPTQSHTEQTHFFTF